MTRRERIQRFQEASMWLAAWMQATVTGEEDPAHYWEEFERADDFCDPRDCSYFELMIDAFQRQQGTKPYLHPELVPFCPEFNFSIN